MGNAQTQKTHYTVEEYFDLENHSEVRHEFYDGEVFAMAGGTKTHNILVDNVKDLIKAHFRPKGCGVYSENVKLEAIRHFYYPYPDVLLTCDKRDAQNEYVVAHPSLIVEVLSESTAAYDRDFKLKRYQRIPSLQYYLLVAQHECSVEVYSRTQSPDVWTYQLFEQQTDRVVLENLAFAFSLSDVYANIQFPPPSEPAPPRLIR